MLVIKRIRVRYRFRPDPGADGGKIERAFEHHMPKCPVYRSIGAAVEVTTELELV